MELGEVRIFLVVGLDFGLQQSATRLIAASDNGNENGEDSYTNSTLIMFNTIIK